jgi:GNAT superfamily N-acetyltransferase
VVTIRGLAAADLSGVDAVDVSECGTVVYHVRDGILEATPERWERRRRGPAEWAPYVAEWADVLAAGGSAFGAFDGDALVGIAVVRPRLTADTAQLVALFVGRGHRRRGIAARLIAEAVRVARTAGAGALYVSATPSASAVGCYLSQGFTLAAAVHPDLLAREPEDIHLARAL